MSDIDRLRVRLRAAARRRRRTRLRDGLLLTAGVVALLALLHYRIDRTWRLMPAARAVLDVLLVGGACAAGVRWIWPAWRRREDEIDVALRTPEGGVDDGLVAALQFDRWLRTGHGHEYGSVGLLEAVVEQTTVKTQEFAPQTEPTERPARWKRTASAAAIAAVVGGAAFFPRHFTAWLDRALLGSADYPSRTQIVSVSINGAPVDFSGAAAPRVVVAENRPLSFEIVAEGAPADVVQVALVDERGERAIVELTAAPEGASKGKVTAYRAAGAAPPATVVVEPRAGDAYGEPFELSVRPLPRITVSLLVTPPAYAEGADLPEPPPGRLSAAVLEGSRVDVLVECANKPLAEAWLTIGGKRTPLSGTTDNRRSGIFEAEETQLADVVEPIEFVVEALDDDGFAPTEALRGSILIRPDQPPTVAAEVVTKYVLPAGKPSIAYQAGDDLGVQSLAVVRQVLRGDGSTAADRVEIPLNAAGSRHRLVGKFPLELESLQLHKGDRVTVRLEARDRNGSAERAVAQSEPFTLEVTDEQGLYEAMAETDQRSARKMDEIIQKQLLMTGRGGSATGASAAAPLVPATSPTPTASPSGTVLPPAAPAPAPSPTPTNATRSEP